MKKRVLLCLALLLVFGCFALASCDFLPATTPTTPAPTVADIKFENATYTYDGTAKSLAATGMPEGTVVTYTGNEKTDAGVYTVTASFQMPAGYATVEPKTATLTINKAELVLEGISFPNVSRPYNKTNQVMSPADIVGTLPEGVIPEVEGTAISNVGSSEFTLTFALSDELKKNYNAPAEMKATLTVTKANIDMSGVSFDDKTVAYAGAGNSITITGTLPTGVGVSYVGNTLQGVGTTEATAIFTLSGAAADNYNVPEEMNATLTVTKGTVDLSKISFQDKIVIYNNRPVELTVSGNVSQIHGVRDVRYENNVLNGHGEVTATVYFDVNTELYNQPKPMTAKLKVIDCSDIAWDYENAMLYDGTEKTVTLKGLPVGVTATYTNNAKTEAGAYIAEAKLYTEFGGQNIELNYSVPQLQWEISTHVADISGLSFPGAEVTYNGTAQKIGIVGELPEGIVSINYTVKRNGITYSEGIDAMVDAATYTITANFVMAEDYAQVPPLSTTFVIKPIVLDMSAVVWDASMKEVVGVAGTTYTVEVLNLPAHVTATYEGNEIEFGAQDSASATAKVTFTPDANYVLPENYSLADFAWSVVRDPWTPSVK